MKYLNCIKQWLHTGKIIRETDFLTCCVVLIACFFVGAAIHCHTEQEHLETSGQILHPETENWGLGFGQTGEKPTGNVSAEELKKHDASATFFVVGNYLETSPELVKQMVAEGHTVGNHTFHHLEMSKISDAASFEKELKDVETLYQKITGEELTRFYRPPQGKYNTQNLQMAGDLGYKTFFWSLAYVDWIQDQQPTKEAAFDKLLKRIHPGAVVLLHSTSSTNAQILDELLTKWEEMGYHFAPLSELEEKI